MFHPLDFGELQLGLDCPYDAFRHAILQSEDVAHLAIEAIGPKVRTGRGVNELSRESKTIARAPNAAFQHIADTELAPNLTDIDGPALVGKGRVACDHEQPAATR